MNALNSRQAMIESQIVTNNVRDARVLAALQMVEREKFVPEEYQKNAYLDEQIPLSKTRYLLEPLVFARMLEAVNIKDADSVLDLACGTGYSTAVLSLLAKKVIGLEDNTDLVQTAKRNLAKTKNVEVIKGDLIKYPKSGFDIIFINGAVEQIPADLTSKLKEGGRLVAVTENFIVVITRYARKFSLKKLQQANAATLKEFKKPQGFKF